MRKTALGLGGFLVLVLAGLWVGPRLVDWEPWRAQLAEVATGRLGRPVVLDGPVELVLLPSPVLRASGVTIAEPPGTEADSGFRVTARMLRLRLDLPALIAGRIEPREIALVGAELTLPWPPGPLLALRPPSWITTLDARVEDGRVRIGATMLEGVTARLSAAGPAQALDVTGSFTWTGRQARFSATLGRPGWDGIAPLDLSVSMPEATGRARGVLVPAGGFEGTLEASGPDLAALLPAPAGPFRATGRLSASAELIAAEQLALDLAGAPARGALAIRLVPSPRLDLALLASRLDLDGWLAALRGGSGQRWPVSVDLSAEAAGFAGLTLRRLRGAAFLEEGRLTLTDVSVLLPGETQLDFAGATAGGRLEVGARFAGPDIRATLAALGLPVANLDPALLRQGDGRLRLVLEAAQAAVPEFAASFGDLRLSGAGTLRHGPRPALGLGITVNRLDLPRWLPQGADPAEIARIFAGLDLNLRLAADQARWGEAVLDRAALDAGVEGGRLTLRRLSGRLAEADLVASGGLSLGAQPRLHDVILEANAPTALGIMALVPGGWAHSTALAAMPLALRISGSGAPEALALRGEATLGEVRAEAQGTLDLPARRGTAALTLRHPGAPRLLAEGFGANLPWLGDGSFSVVANVTAGPQGMAAESFEVVAGSLRAGGALALAHGARPRLSGRIAAERLPLPLPALRGAEPLGLERLAGFDAELALDAARIEAGGLVADAASATLRLANGQLGLDRMRARIAGGTLEAGLEADVRLGIAPRLTLELSLADVALTGPALGLPYDLSAGRGGVTATLGATGHAPAALLGTLSGRLAASLRDGVLTGLDLRAAAAAAALPDALEAEARVRQALLAGATAFERLELDAVLETGRLRITSGQLAGEGGVSASMSGSADLARGALDLRIGARPAPEAPELGLRVTGPASAPRSLPEISDWARWRAE
jgi:hypothetical protein